MGILGILVLTKVLCKFIEVERDRKRCFPGRGKQVIPAFGGLEVLCKTSGPSAPSIVKPLILAARKGGPLAGPLVLGKHQVGHVVLF